MDPIDDNLRVEIFWKRIQMDVGIVLPHIQNILNLEGLAANESIAELTEDDISMLEAQMRERGMFRACVEIRKNPSKKLEDYFRDFADAPELFCFSMGDRKVIRSISAAVKRNGIAKYIPNIDPNLQLTGPLSSGSLGRNLEVHSVYSSPESQVNHAVVLIERLKRYYEKHAGSMSDSVLVQLLEVIDNINVRFESGTGGKEIAWVKCPVCTKQTGSGQKQLKVVREPPRSWSLCNLLKHFNCHFELDCESHAREGVVKQHRSTAKPRLKRLKEMEMMNQGDFLDELIEESDSSKERQSDALDEDVIRSGCSVANVGQMFGQSTMESGTDEETLGYARGYEINTEFDPLEVEDIVGLQIEPADHHDNFDMNTGICERSASGSTNVSDPLPSTSRSIFGSRLTGYGSKSASTSDDNDGQPSGQPFLVECEGPSNTQFEHSVSPYDFNDSVLLKSLAEVHSRVKNEPLNSRRYTELEKDISTFEYLTGGKAHFEYIAKNITTMSIKTIMRHLKKNTVNIQEGKLDINGLKSYLVTNNLPMAVVLCEDATRITATVEYNHENDSLSGLVAPFDSDGLPQMGSFPATSPYTIIDDIERYPVGSYAYVQLAVPLSQIHAPFVLFHCCTDNKFHTTDVINRWKYTELQLHKEGIRVIANASDGDSRLMKAMKIRSGFEQQQIHSGWGPWYRVNDELGFPMNVQDMIHCVNKFRNRMKKGDMQIGIYTISKTHLKELVINHSKDKHQLNMSDIEIKDKMKFSPTLKMINEDMIRFLHATIPNSEGTVLFLKLMKMMYRSYVEEDVSPQERLLEVWTANLIVRGWRNWCKLRYNNLQNCVTTNAYLSLELNAHALISFIRDCRNRNAPEQFHPSFLSSQHCEKLFRQLRSMTSTNQTVVNFTIKEMTEKLRRIQMKMFIMYKHADSINFPILDRRQNNQHIMFNLPSDEQIINIVGRAHEAARQALLDVGFYENDISLLDSVNLNLLPSPEFVGVEDEIHSWNDTHSDNETAEAEEQRNGANRSMTIEFIEVNGYTPELIPDLHENTEQIYDAAHIFQNCDGSLNLRSTTSGEKHTFRVADSNGQIKTIKKSTLIWMLTSGRYRLSTDRMRRFIQN